MTEIRHPHLQKDEGYDEFLAEKIAKAREDVKQGRYITYEAFQEEMEAFLAQLEREQQIYHVLEEELAHA